MKSVNTNGQTLVPIVKYKSVASILNQCSAIRANSNERNSAILNKLQSMMNWIRTSPSPIFECVRPRYIVLGPDFSLYAILTWCGIWLSFDPLPVSNLSKVIAILKDKKHKDNKVQVVFHEDIANTTHFIQQSHLFDEYISKMKDLQFAVNNGDSESETKVDSETKTKIDTKNKIDTKTKIKITIPPVVYREAPLIPFNSIIELIDHTKKEANETKQWNMLKQRIGKYLLADMSTSKIDLQEAFKGTGSDKMVKVVIDELFETVKPFNESNLYAWVARINAEVQLPWYNTLPQFSKETNSWVFSQSAVEAGLPKEVVLGKGVRPNNTFITANASNKSIIPQTLMTVVKAKLLAAPKVQKFTMNDPGKTEQVELPVSKWKKSWTAFTQLVTKPSIPSKDALPMLFEYLCSVLGLQYTYNDIATRRNAFICSFIGSISMKAAPSLLLDPTPVQLKGLIGLFDDVDLRNLWTKKKFINSSKFVEDYMLKKTKKELMVTCRNNQNNPAAPPCFLDVEIMSQLLSISIFVIHRAPTVKGAKDVPRGSDEDRLLSSTFFSAGTDAPLLILERSGTYSVIVRKTAPLKILFDVGDLEKDIVNLLEVHLMKNKKPTPAIF